MKQQINIRLDNDTARQMRELRRTWDTTQTGTIARCVERAYQQETNTMKRSARHAAEARVDSTPELQPFRDLLLEYDWNDDGHMEWVATAPIAEIVDWAEIIRQGEREQAEAALGAVRRR